MQKKVLNKKSKIPIGFEDDSGYLGFIGKILQNVFVVPEVIKKIKNIEDFRHLTSYFLLKESELSLISIWNPTFLLLILEYICQNQEKLIKEIYDY